MPTTIRSIESVSQLTVCRIVRRLERKRRIFGSVVKKVSQNKPGWIKLSTNKREVLK